MDVSWKIEVPLPHMIRQGLIEEAGRFLERHRHRFGFARLQVHLKRVGSQVGCFANLYTDDGRYHVSESDWDVRTLIGDVLDTLDLQIAKRFDKRAEQAG